MGSPSDKLTRLRGELGKAANIFSDEGKKLIGDAGEFLTENLLDKSEVSWIKTVQHENVYSSILRESGIARPDYLVRFEADNFFLDSKHLSRTTSTRSEYGFSIGKTEHERLRKAEDHFEMPVLFIIWDRTDTKFTYLFTELNAFSTPKYISGRSCLEAIFPLHDLFQHDL